MDEEKYEIIKPLIRRLQLSKKDIEALMTLQKDRLRMLFAKLRKLLTHRLPSETELNTANLLWSIWKTATDRYGYRIKSHKKYIIEVSGTLLYACQARATVLYAIMKREKNGA